MTTVDSASWWPLTGDPGPGTMNGNEKKARAESKKKQGKKYSVSGAGWWASLCWKWKMSKYYNLHTINLIMTYHHRWNIPDDARVPQSGATFTLLIKNENIGTAEGIQIKGIFNGKTKNRTINNIMSKWNISVSEWINPWKKYSEKNTVVKNNGLQPI